MQIETLRKLAEENGWDTADPKPSEWDSGGPGKFEGEGIATLYFYDAMMNGCGDSHGSGEETVADSFDIGEEDREILGDLIPPDAAVAVLFHSSSGFETLEFATREEFDTWEAELDEEEEEEEA